MLLQFFFVFSPSSVQAFHPQPGKMFPSAAVQQYCCCVAFSIYSIRTQFMWLHEFLPVRSFFPCAPFSRSLSVLSNTLTHSTIYIYNLYGRCKSNHSIRTHFALTRFCPLVLYAIFRMFISYRRIHFQQHRSSSLDQ